MAGLFPKATVSNEFGVLDSRAKFGRHAGIDYAVAVGTPVPSPVSGYVTDYVWGKFHGHTVQIFDGRYYHRLMHNSRLLVKPSQSVQAGEIVAKSGATGEGITGPHVHHDVATKKIPTSFADFIDPNSLTEVKVEGVQDVVDKNLLNNLYMACFERNPFNNQTGVWDDPAAQVWLDKPADVVLQALLESGERVKYLASKNSNTTQFVEVKEQLFRKKG